MKSRRGIVSALVGIIFLIQGLAVVAGPLPLAETGQSKPAAEMPCHGQGDSNADDNGSCCDADCPDMTSCLLGQLAFARGVVFSATQTAAEIPLLLTPRASSRAPPPLLRPPISLHG